MHQLKIRVNDLVKHDTIEELLLVEGIGCSYPFSVRCTTYKTERELSFPVQELEFVKKYTPRKKVLIPGKYKGMNFILRGTGWAGNHASSSVAPEDRHMLNKIQSAAMTDEDINAVQSGDNATLKQEMQKKTNELQREKQFLDRDYGKDVFDGKDASGQLVKLMDFKPSEDGALL